jgi:hypothetical protein
MRLPTSRFAREDQRASFGDEVHGQAEPSICKRKDD